MVELARTFSKTSLGSFLRDIYEKKQLILQLTRRDFKIRYAGSTLGLFWAFFQPLMMMLILLFVFTVGLKTGQARGGVPFAAWFFPAMIAWNYFADAVLMSSNVLNEYSFLVKKVKFRVSILPLVKLLASTILHSIFILILIAVLAFCGIYPSLIWFQVFYYMAASFVLLAGLSWITSSLNIFLKDVGQVVGILIQFGFWATPVIWDSTNVPSPYQKLIKLNPMYYIVEGYRDTFIYHIPFWKTGAILTLYFWTFSIVLLISGILIFRKLRPHFADVL